MLKVGLNGCDEFAYAAKDSAAELLVSQVAEEAFHHVQPRSTGGSIVHVKARMLLHPVLYCRMFVSCVVVDDDVNLFFFWGLLVNKSQEFEPLLMSMSWHAGANDFAVQNVERGKQRGGSVALVVMSHGASAPFLERQPWLSSV